MDLQLGGKRALVTGASSGIGAAIVRRLAMEGCNVVAVARTAADLQRVKEEVERETGRRIDIAPTDLAARGSATALAKAWPDVDILVNNAGEDPTGRLAEIDEDCWREAWDLKVFGYINLCREYYEVMKQRGGGVIVNVIGVAHLVRDARYICGATSTAAVTALTQALGGTSLHDGIRVVGVGPGVTSTPRLVKGAKLAMQYNPKLAELFERGDPDLDDLADHIGQGLGLARGGRPEEIAAITAFIASPEAAYMSGTMVYSDGGWSRT